ncbi:MarR family transcriptional regulator [Acetobacter malorum]|jgi:MarR family transcriptional regulator, transcriptional regulator for hemolysin|uniref:MarR family transcriptional regulator n=11 Tax=Acetobacterales TaxID=3120395 RepID=A0A850NLJ2_9PROT|nr:MULTISPECIES: MarR family winged helix-turn-helix transcriptional regulator [Acetobacteraceae]ETC97400.1 MarR family transcriptional regulator [Asaia sp. SF2.1]KXV18015.1 MarR family transcriptional regulator [Acetobacter malorum]KXV48583.1 MarR family transcriptional regulator [Gluconobacter albidus]MBB3173749.1 DNA-binding MarR family transcriptional regulator [Endobacter medicaginis]MCX5474971.1 MarR family transcriptional regulator [Endobacter medicaginis]
MKEDSKPYKWPSRTDSLGYMVNWAARLFAREMDEALRPFGLMSGQLPVIFALADGKTRSQRELVNLAAVEQSTMAKTLSRMERDGLIERKPDPNDRRSTTISLSPLMSVRLPEVAAAVAVINARSHTHLSEEEGERLLDLLHWAIKGLAERP